MPEGWHVIVHTPSLGSSGKPGIDEEYYAWISDPDEAAIAVRTEANASTGSAVLANKEVALSDLQGLTGHGLKKGGVIKWL